MSSKPSKSRNIKQAGSHHVQASGSRKDRKKKAAGSRIFAVVLILVVLCGLFFGAKALFGGGGDTNGSWKVNGKEVIVTIPEGSTGHDFAEILGDAGVIRSERAFLNAVEDAGVGMQLKPGEYTFTKNMDMDELIQALVTGPIIQLEGNTLVIPEGLKLSEVAKRVESATGIKAEDFIDRATSADEYVAEYPFLEGVYGNSMEGFLYPKTYTIPYDEDADYVVRVMLDQFQIETAELDLAYPSSRGLSFYDAIILASVVEKEVGPGPYASTVASVFYNRLNEGMRLQSDITMLYSVDWDESKFDASDPSPYNTYYVDGLPAGPICSPYIETLEAVCHPEETDYLFFFSIIDTGETLFSKTVDEHDAIVAKYR